MEGILLFLEGISNFFGFFGDANFSVSDSLGFLSGIIGGTISLVGAFAALGDFIRNLAGLFG